MPKPAKGARLGSGPAHEKLMLAGLAAALIRDERIRTTEAKAKRLRPVAERLITLGKNSSVHSRRQALALIEDRDVIHKLFAEVAPRYSDRNGGYTRILKLGFRKGDAAPMALIELVEGEAGAESLQVEETKKRRRLGRRRAKAPQVEEEESLAPEPHTSEVEPEEPQELPEEPDEAVAADERSAEAESETPDETEPAAEEK